MNTEQKSKSVSIQEIAAALDLGANTVYAAAKRGELPFPVVRVGRRFVVPRAPFEAFIQTGKNSANLNP